jgi:hypothetical protein
VLGDLASTILSVPAEVSASRRTRDVSFGLLQPVRHAHLAIHRRRGGEVFSGLFGLARTPVELAEAEVAVGDEGAHAELLAEPKGFAVCHLCFAEVRWFAAGRDLPKQLEGVRLDSLFLVFPCKVEGMLSVIDRLSPKASRQTRFAQPRNNARNVKLP